MENSALIFLIISCAISFGIGRTVVYFRNKRRAKIAKQRELEALRNRPVEPESKNKSKRKRQLQQLSRDSKKQ